DAVVEGCQRLCRPGLDPGVEDREWGLPVERSVGPAVVVVVAKGVELELELGQRASWRLPAEKALEGLVEALDLAAGLRVGGGRVFEGDPEAFEFQLEQDPASPGPAGEDGGVVAEQGSRQTEGLGS